MLLFQCFSSGIIKIFGEIKDTKKFNSQFEDFIDTDINGVDLTTIINKALENNNKYEIKRNSKGVYENDNKNSIEIMVRPEENSNIYPMEAFEKVGLKDFTKNFGNALFKSTKVEYHKNGRISKIIYEIQRSNVIK